jgi:hypothetical protein
MRLFNFGSSSVGSEVARTTKRYDALMQKDDFKVKPVSDIITPLATFIYEAGLDGRSAGT